MHVDNALVVGPKEHASGLIKEMEEHLKMKVEKPMVHEGGKTKMLGRWMRRTAHGFRHGGGRQLVEMLAQELDLEAGVGREVRTPAVPGQANGSPDGETLSEEELHWFRCQVGRLQHVAMDRPDVQHAARALARVMTKATSRHVHALVRIVKYLLRWPGAECNVLRRRQLGW